MTDALNAPEMPETDSGSSGLTRRSVVRTGAHLAWAVPAVQLATSAPALAASNEPELKIGAFNASATTKSAKAVLGPVTNTGTGTAGQVTAIVKFPVSGKLDRVPAGWKSVGSKSGKTFSFITTSPIGPKAKTKSLTVAIDFPKKLKKKPKGTVSVLVKGKGGASDSDTDKL